MTQIASAQRLMALGLPAALAKMLTGTDSSTPAPSLALGTGEFFYESFSDSITAHAGGGQTSATALTSELNRITTVATAADSIALPASVAGLTVIVENAATKPMQVFGAGTDTVNGVATATGVSQMAGSVVIYTCYTAGAWFANGLGTGYSGSLETMSYADAVSAAGTTQATGTQLAAMVNTVSTVSAGQGVNLPASAAGVQIVVINAGASPLLVYPLIGATDTINGVAATIGVSILPGTVATFSSTAAGAWVTMPATTKNAAFNTNSTASGAITLTAANITGGAASVDLALTGAQGGGVNAQLPTVAAMVAALHSPTVGTSFRLRILNEGSTQIITVTTNTGWTLSGTMTLANNTWRDFCVTLTTLSAATIQNAGTGTFS